MVYNGQLDCQVRMWWPHSLVSSLQLHNIMTWHMHAFFRIIKRKRIVLLVMGLVCIILQIVQSEKFWGTCVFFNTILWEKSIVATAVYIQALWFRLLSCKFNTSFRTTALPTKKTSSRVSIYRSHFPRTMFVNLQPQNQKKRTKNQTSWLSLCNFSSGNFQSSKTAAFSS